MYLKQYLVELEKKTRRFYKILCSSKYILKNQKYLVSTCTQISQELQKIFGAKVSLDEVTKYINSQTNNKSQIA